MKLGHCIRACFAVGLAYFASEPIARATDWKLTALAADGEEKWAGLWNPASREALWLKTGARRAGVVLVSCDMDLQIAEIETENGRATLPLAAGMEAPGGFTDEDISRMLDTMPPEAVGKLIGVANAPTSFGLVTAALQVEQGGATFVMGADWHAAPSRVILHLPYCVSLVRADGDRPGLKQEEGPRPVAYESTDMPAAGADGGTTYLVLPPDTTHVTLRWEKRPGAALSYEAAVTAWQEAYAARYREYLNAGKEPVTLTPIPLR